VNVISFTYLFAFGFGNLWMLGWLAAAAAPILIHLWNKRKYREVSWAAMEYLLAALRKNSRRMRLEQLLLLIIRTLIILLIVTALAQPFLESAGLSFVGAQRSLKVLVVDGSYSMAYKPTDKSRFDRAKQLAAQIVDESKQGDAFALILMAEPPQVVIGTPAMEVRSVQDEIEALQLTHGGGDLQATLAKLEQILASPEADELPRKEVYFLTDLGRTTWLPDENPAAVAAYRERVQRLAEQASLIAIDLGQDANENLAISSAVIKQPFVLTSQPASIELEVKNFGRQPHNGQIVELLADERRLGQTKIDIPAAGQATATFQHRWDAPGNYALEVRLAADLLDIDNHRYLALPVKQSLDVLVVDGKPGSGQFTGAGDYVALALSPEQKPSSASPVKVERISESLLQERELGRYDCVFLCNVAQFTASEARMLESYLKQGGGLIFFLGDRVLSERYNRELAGEQGPRVLPVELAEAAVEGDYRFDPLDYRHPLVSTFQGSEQAGLVTTPIYKYVRLKVPANSSAKVALAFDTGDPAIVEATIARGRSIVVATDGSLSSVANPTTKTPWTSMAAWPSFVPIVHELLAWAITQQGSDRNSTVGQPIGGEAPASAVSRNLVVQTPGGREQAVQTDAAAGESHWTYADTNLSGVYTLSAAGGEAGQPFAVNVDTRESDLSRAEISELPPEIVTSERSNLDDTTSAAVSRETGFHRWLLYGVLGLLLVESLLAWRFGNSST
jgi:hypothetical protein